ncbi:MAG: hypothetical protein ACJAUE_000804 [Alcanivorax sp.]|jgi:hypothetical protein
MTFSFSDSLQPNLSTESRYPQRFIFFLFFISGLLLIRRSGLPHAGKPRTENPNAVWISFARLRAAPKAELSCPQTPPTPGISQFYAVGKPQLVAVIINGPRVTSGPPWPWAEQPLTKQTNKE